MTGSIPVYYWDACVFLAWLKNETTRKPGEMEGLNRCIERLKRGQIKIATSVLTYTEMTIAKIPAGVDTMFEEVMQRPNCTRISVDMPVAKLARDIRNHYLNTRKDGFTVTIPDSLHLATAILYRVDEFHTFDERDDRSRKILALLPLDGDVAGHNLKICKPSSPQLELALPDESA